MILCLTSCKTRNCPDETWDRILKSDLSETVINPSRIATDEVVSWWSDEALAQWKECGNDTEDIWIERQPALGFRGENYSRLDIHLASVSKVSSTQYDVEGEVRCEGVISQFSGCIVLDSFEEFTDTEEYCFLRQPYHVGIISAHYEFDIPSLDAKMYGTSTYDVLEIDNEIYYDAVFYIADGFCNNLYEGVWRDMSSNEEMKCNWGDCRIPDSGDLDIGAGEFAVNEKYINNGWEL